MPSAPDTTALIGVGAIFTLFFITLGPLKILGPFAQLTRETDEATMRRIAVRAFIRDDRGRVRRPRRPSAARILGHLFVVDAG